MAITASGAGVAFDTPATPGELPGGNNADPDFVTTAGFSADSTMPVANGVNPSEWVALTFALAAGMTLDDVLAAIWAKDLRFGLHVQAIFDANGQGGLSESYVTHTPLPPALLLFGSGLVGLCLLSRRRARKQQATALRRV
jgi:hypothetical protein